MSEDRLKEQWRSTEREEFILQRKHYVAEITKLGEELVCEAGLEEGPEWRAKLELQFTAEKGEFIAMIEKLKSDKKDLEEVHKMKEKWVTEEKEALIRAREEHVRKYAADIEKLKAEQIEGNPVLVHLVTSILG